MQKGGKGKTHEKILLEVHKMKRVVKGKVLILRTLWGGEKRIGNIDWRKRGETIKISTLRCGRLAESLLKWALRSCRNRGKRGNVQTEDGLPQKGLRNAATLPREHIGRERARL